MKESSVKSDLRNIAAKLPDSAGYDEAMYELYVCKKIAQGKQAAKEGRLISHDAVKREFNPS